MSRCTHTIALLTTAVLGANAFAGGWVNFVEETSVRMPTGPGLNNPATSTADPEEKDYAWGDLDNDGDLDIVCVRKQPFTSTGKKSNVLFMNEGIAEGHALNGVFVDRTSSWAAQSDVSGDNGFLTPTNDRDVAIVDVNGDGWLDVVTATTLTDNQAKHLSHPRVYMNLGEENGVWRGLRYEDARIPQMHPTAGPRFCSVSAGDVTGDGHPDLYFGDYDSGGAQIFDYNNRLLINDGNGFFTDQTNSRLTSEMSLAAFGAASIICDINNDGVNDVVKQTSLNSPTHVAITYNNPGNQGVFSSYDTIYSNAPYFVSAGDLNNDGRLDLVVVDDGTDRYMLNQGGSPEVSWTTLTFPSGPSGGFGGNSISADLDNDGWEDVLITDVDVDISGCSRRMHIYKNGGGTQPSLTEIGSVIPDNLLAGTHDVAVLDINNDGWLDLVVGRCTDTRIWMNVPPTGIVFSYPSGLPGFVAPGEETDFQVSLSIIGDGEPVSGSEKLFVSVDNGPFVESSLASIGKSLYSATLPASSCTSVIRYYIRAEHSGGGMFFDPAGAPALTYQSIAAEGTEITLRDEVEADVSGWQTLADPSVTSGFWEAVDPVGTINGGDLAAPEDDATAGAENVKAWVTQNGAPGGAAGAADLDGGPVTLVSPVFDLAGTDATISYARWFYNDDADDVLVTEISNDGGSTWTTVTALTTGSTGSAWEDVTFVAGDWIATTSNMRVRWIASDAPNNSVTEAGIDNFQIEEVICGAPCPADIDGSGDVGFNDLVALLSGWGACGDPCDADLDGSGDVGFNDLVALLSAWGPCDG